MRTQYIISSWLNVFCLTQLNLVHTSDIFHNSPHIWHTSTESTHLTQHTVKSASHCTHQQHISLCTPTTDLLATTIYFEILLLKRCWTPFTYYLYKNASLGKWHQSTLKYNKAVFKTTTLNATLSLSLNLTLSSVLSWFLNLSFSPSLSRASACVCVCVKYNLMYPKHFDTLVF